MKKIIYEYEGMSTVTELNMKYAVAYYEKYGFEYRIRRAAEVTKEDIMWCDIYYSCRPYCFDSYCNAKAVKEAGCFYYVFFDDDLLNLDSSYSKRKEYAKKCLALADFLESSSPLIAKEYSKFGKSGRYYVSNTPIKKDEICRTPNDDVIHMIYAAGNNHEAAFEKYIGPGLNNIFEKYGDKVDLTFICVNPDTSDVKNKNLIMHVDGMPLEEYNRYMKEHHFDIGLAPLEDNWFCNRKYYNKYLEYAKVGICGLYSNCLPYTYIIKDGENGYLVDSNPNEWEKAICKAIEEVDERERIIVNSQEQLANCFSPEDIENSLAEHAPELFTYQRPNLDFEFKKNKFKRTIFVYSDRIYRAFYIARHKGVKSMINTIINHLSRG